MGGGPTTWALNDTISGLTFLFMGLLILYLAQTRQLAMSGEFQITVNIYLTNLTQVFGQYLDGMPAIVWVVAFAAILAVIVKTSLNAWRRP